MFRSFLLICSLIMAVHTHAQKLFGIGLKGGLSRDNMRLENVADHTPIPGWHAGVFLRVKPPLAPGVQAEALYNSMGTDLRITDSIASDAAIRLRYFQVPVFLVFSIGPAEIHLGGYGSHLLNSSISRPTQVFGEMQDLNDDQFRDSDHGLLGGLGLKLGRVQVGGRYLLGLGTVGASNNSILGNTRNMQAQFYIGYGFVK